MREKSKEMAHEMKFAKVVETRRGKELLISGNTYQVIGPDGDACDLFARAMRQSGNVNLCSPLKAGSEK